MIIPTDIAGIIARQKVVSREMGEIATEYTIPFLHPRWAELKAESDALAEAYLPALHRGTTQARDDAA